jgi:tetratricopeptide (TPR) repeat protein
MDAAPLLNLRTRLTYEENRAIAKALAGSDDQARTAAEEELSTLTDTPHLEVLEQAAWRALDTHNYSALQRILERLDETFPDRSMDMRVVRRIRLLGYAAQKTGDTDAALRYHRRHIAKSISNTEQREELAAALHNLADTYLQRGENDAAYPLLRVSTDLYCSLPGSAPPETILHLLEDLSLIDHKRGDPEAERGHREEALSRMRSSGGDDNVCRALIGLARFHAECDDYDKARTLGDEAVDLGEVSMPHRRRSRYDLLHSLAWWAHQMQDVPARDAYVGRLRHALMAETIPRLRAVAARCLAHTCLLGKDEEQARRYLEMCLDAGTATDNESFLGTHILPPDLPGDRGMVLILAEVEYLLGGVMWRSGDMSAAARHFRGCLKRLMALTDDPPSRYLREPIAGLSGLAQRFHHYERAAVLAGMGDADWVGNDASSPLMSPQSESLMRKRLGSRRYNRLRAQGKAMKRDAAIAYALDTSDDRRRSPWLWRRWFRKRGADHELP